MITQFKEYCRKQSFHPDWFGIFINPYYLTRKSLDQQIRLMAPSCSGKILDVGCGSKPYINYFHFTEYIGLEIDSKENRQAKRADYFYDGETFPFSDASFDTVVTSQVLEHVFNPARFVAEIYRVLKPDGHLLLTVPFIWDEHEQPFDYGRYSSFGLRHLLSQNGLIILKHEKSLSDSRALFQLINAYIYKNINSTSRWKNRFVMLFFMSPFNLAGELFYRILPANNDFFLDNIVLAQKPLL